jgi:hypothetical protein
MMLSLAWILRWVVFAVIGVSALLLYVFPRHFSGPVTARERSEEGRMTIWAHLARYGTPLCAVVGLALLLPVGGCPDSIAYTSLTAGGPARGLDPDDPSARFACAVEGVLARATDLAHGRAPGREQLRQAVEDQGLDADCRGVPPSELPNAALIESLEITMLMLHVQAGRLRSVTVRPGPLYSDFDAWAVAEPVLDRWTDFDIDLRGRTKADIYRLDRARIGIDGSTLTVWAVASAAALCKTPPIAQLYISGIPRPCTLDPGSVAEVCSARGDGMVAVFAKLSCEGADSLAEPDRSRQPRAELHWGSAPEVPVVQPSLVSVAIKGDRDLWTEALELAQLDNRAAGFANVLRDWGYQLPESDPTSRVILDLSHENHIEIRSDGSCVGPGAPADLALPGGPFSFDGLRPDDQAMIRAHDGCVSIAVPPAALRRPTHATGDAYEPTRFYATMGAITWVANCVESGCQGRRPIAPEGGRAYPLLSRAEVDELLGAKLWRDWLGLFLMGVSLCLMALRYLWSVDPR